MNTLSEQNSPNVNGIPLYRMSAFAPVLCLSLLLQLIFPALSMSWSFVQGTVIAENAQPVADAVLSTNSGSADTLADGTYVTGHLAGTFNLTVSADGYTSQTVSISAADGETVSQDFTLLPAPVTIDSVSPNWGQTGQSMESVVQGSSFDDGTRLSMSLDTGNQKSIIGSLLGTEYEKVMIHRGGAYIDSIDHLAIIDVQDPTTPVPLTTITGRQCGLDELACRSTIIENRLYMPTGAGLQIFDITNPSAPALLGEVTANDLENAGLMIGADANRVTVDGDTVFLSSDIGLIRIDLTDLANPAIDCLIPVGHGDLVVQDGLGLLTRVNSLLTIDLANQECLFDEEMQMWEMQQPVVLNDFPLSETINEMIIAGETAYIRDHGGFHIVSITDWLVPSLEISVSHPDISGFTLAGDILYLVDGDLQFYNISNPENPSLVGTTTVTGGPTDVAFSGGIAYVVKDGDYEDEGLVIIDGTVPTPPQTVATLDTMDAWSVEISGDIAFVVDKNVGLQIVDISNPLTPVILSSVPIVEPISVSVNGKIAWVLSKSAFYVIDATDSSTPLSVSVPVSDGRYFSVADGMAYIAGSDFLTLIDVANPAFPELKGTTAISILDSYQPPTILETTVYVPGGWSGLNCVDVTDPMHPVSYLYGSKIYSLALFGTTAYAQELGYTIQVLDLSLSPTSPVLEQTVNRGSGDSLLVRGNLLYAGSNVFSLTNPLNPVQLGSDNSINLNRENIVIGDNVYINAPDGFWAVELSNPMHPVLFGSMAISGTVDIAVTEDEKIALLANRTNGLYLVPVPVELTRTDPVNDTDKQITATIPATQLAGNYTIRVFNDRYSATLPGGITLSDDKILSKAIIVAGYGPHSSNWLWDETRLNAGFAYKSLRWQGYSDDEIYYLSDVPEDLNGDGNSDVDDDATESNLQNAILSWASDADDLLLYMVDHGGKDTFHIQYNAEALQASNLADWLNTHQELKPNGRAIMVYEGCYSGSFLDALKVPEGKSYDRIIMTSSTADEKSKLLAGGALSFSYQFWAMIFDTGNIINGFNHGYDMMLSSQTAWLDSNGDGNPNTFDDTISNPVIGRGYKSAPGVPSIVDIVAPQQISETTSAELWVEVMTFNPLSRVWAVIVPPEYDRKTETDSHLQELPVVELSYSGTTRRWQAISDEFTANGIYNVSFYAEDSKGNISMPKITTVSHSVGPDDQEDDDSYLQANSIILNRQVPRFHTIHDTGDEDWLKFYGLAGESYAIKVASPGPKMDAVIEIYGPDGSTLIKSKNTIGALPGAEELLTWDTCNEDGVYYIKIYHANILASGIGNNYELTLYNPDLADFPAFVSLAGSISVDGGGALNSASIMITGTASSGGSYQTTAITDSAGSYSLELPPGNYTIIVDAEGYQPKNQPMIVESSGNFPLDLGLIPDKIPPTADAGADQTVNLCESIILDGTDSSDNGTIVSWEWTLHHNDDSDNSQDIHISGPNELGDPVLATTSVPGIGTYTVTLDVIDDEGAFDMDSMELAVGSAWGDVNGDCQVGLEEAVNALQVTSGQ